MTQAAAPLPVVFALEDRNGTYWPYTAVAITSILQHARRPVEIHLLHGEELSSHARGRLCQVAADLGAELRQHTVRLPPSVDVAGLRQFGPATLYRLMIPQLFADHDLVVYADSDIVCNGLDITELEAIVPADAPLAGVMDRYIGIPERHRSELATLGLDIGRYFNAGILAIRPPLIGEDLLAGYLRFEQEHPGLLHPDQDFLNHHFEGRIHPLDPKFNYVVGVFERRALDPLTSYAGKLLHYAAMVKPLDGLLGPGVLPFWAHAYRVPEIVQGNVGANPDRYLVPWQDYPHRLTVHQVGPKRG